MAEGHARAKNQDRFHAYIYKVLKLIHPDLAISTIAITVIDSLAKFTLRRLAEQAKIVLDLKKAKKLDSNHIEEAVGLALPGALYKHGVVEGDKALVRYNNNKDLPTRSLTAKAGVVFPVARVKKLLKLHTNIRRIDNSAAVYLAAVCEYLAAEVLELAGTAANELNDRRIMPPHIAIEIERDNELSQFFQHVLIHRKESVIPRINRALVDGVEGPIRTKSFDTSVQNTGTTPSSSATNINDNIQEEYNGSSMIMD